MRHAGSATLDALEPLLRRLRAIDGLIEKKRGIFYRKSQAFLHFHEDPAGFFADVRIGPDKDFQRLPVSSPREQRALLDVLRAALGPSRGGA